MYTESYFVKKKKNRRKTYIFTEFINKNNSLLKYYNYLSAIARNTGIKIIIMSVLLLCIPSIIHLHLHIDESIALARRKIT